MAYLPNSGSVVAFQTTASNLNVAASIIGTVPITGSGSVVAFQGTNPWIITGSVQGSFTPSGNQSVSGTVGASIIGNVPVVVQGSVATVIIGGSIAASFTPPANQSVSGTVNVGNFPTTQNVSGSVAAFVVGNSSIITVVQSSVAVAIISGSIAATFSPPANQSVSGTIGASLIGQLPSGTAVLGSIATLQGTNPWNIAGSVAAVQTGIRITSVISSNPSSMLVGASIIGAPPVTQGGTWIASVFGNLSVLGTVPVTQSGTWITSLVSTIPSSVLVGASIFGALPGGNAVLGGVAASISGTVNMSGSVVAFQGTNPWIVGSIVGTYAEDAASATGDKGFLVMGARNDTLSSVTSADGDYSSHVVGPSGELIAANAPFTKWVSGTASALGGTPVTGSLIPVIAAQGASIFTYITGIQIANPSANNAWITLLGGTNSVIGFTMAPANGGSNIYYQNGLKTNANAIFSASVSAVSSIYLSAQGFIAKI